jgi:hypothetical protein
MTSSTAKVITHCRLGATGCDNGAVTEFRCALVLENGEPAA